MTQPNPKRAAFGGIRAVAADSGAFLIEFIPEMNMIKTSHKDSIFLIDLGKLNDLHARGIRAVKVTPVSQVKQLIIVVEDGAPGAAGQ